MTYFLYFADTDIIGLVVLVLGVLFIFPIKPFRWFIYLLLLPVIYLAGGAMWLYEFVSGKWFDSAGPR